MQAATTAIWTCLAAAGAGAAIGLSRPDLPEPVTTADYYDTSNEAKVELGRLLFFDKLISGNQNISCATCHHPELASADGLALPLGEGAAGLGPARFAGATHGGGLHERVPRNSPALFNVGAKEYVRMFHDGRVEPDPHTYFEGGFITPAKWKLPKGLDNVLAAQAMFPVTSPAEMAGQKGENDVANARSLNNAAGPGGVWQLLADRLRANDEYVQLFKNAYPDDVTSPDDITFVQAANAIAAFETEAFRADNSPFDAFLRGEAELTPDAARGMTLFYGKANCASCHSGPFQTDHDFHAIAMPQIGPGKSDGWNQDYWRTTGLKAFPEDHGRARETMREEDMFKFRTPSLRNVELTGPYGHAGAYATLEEVIRHHLDPVTHLEAYQPSESLLQPIEAIFETTAEGSSLHERQLSPDRYERFMQRDLWVQAHDELRQAIADANELEPMELSDQEISDLIAFLESLTDPSSRDLMHLVPDRVPSGLPVND